MASRHVLKRFVRYADDAQTISGHIQTISWSIQSFTVSLLLVISSSRFGLILDLDQVETMLAIEFTLDVSDLFTTTMYSRLTYSKELEHAAIRIEGKLDHFGENMSSGFRVRVMLD